MANPIEKIEVSSKLRCYKCERLVVANSSNYYTHKNILVTSKYYPLCKKCIGEYLGDNDKSADYINRIREILSRINKPFLNDLWLSSGEEWGEYAKNILSLTQYRELTYENSTVQTIEHVRNDSEKEPSAASDEELINKWGNGFQPEEYLAFERKYNFIKKDYPTKTSMHVEALKKFCRYAVKEEFALSANQFKDAESYSKLASKAAEDAKINPKQLSKSDLTDGVDSFSELTKVVETAVDVISILPRFKERPHDKVDVTLWCYINYVRDMQSLPPAKYKDIYEFYDQRKRDYEEGIDFDEQVGDILE
jgi:hypothetical protein